MMKLEGLVRSYAELDFSVLLVFELWLSPILGLFVFSEGDYFL